MASQALISNTTDKAQRPPSVRTNESSTFADSAISVGSRTPTHIDESGPDMTTPQIFEPCLSDRLNQLAAVAWANEQEGLLSDRQQDKIRRALRTVEDCLEDRDEEEKPGEERRITQKDDGVDESQLKAVHEKLATTVAQMRLRAQEQRHLHQLSIKKLDAVAQTCLKQEERVKELNKEAETLLQENRKLVTENSWMQHHISNLESDATQKDVAVGAMSSAVAGLEGWINSSPGGPQTPTRSRGKYVVRGRGRFRGRYWVEDPEQEDVPAEQVPDSSVDARELQEGVKAWVRGFRDVEEELKRATPQKPLKPSENRAPAVMESEQASLDDLPSSEDDDWGDFEAVSVGEITR